MSDEIGDTLKICCWPSFYENWQSLRTIWVLGFYLEIWVVDNAGFDWLKGRENKVYKLYYFKLWKGD